MIALVISLTGCNKRSGEAIVTGKEYIEAVAPGATPEERQLDREQWIVNVRMVYDGRRVNILLDDKAQWDRYEVDQRIHVTYQEGKYTGTVWGAEITK